jgi:hypothetical protein
MTAIRKAKAAQIAALSRREGMDKKDLDITASSRLARLRQG